jgi:hypothetical protein
VHSRRYEDDFAGATNTQRRQWLDERSYLACHASAAFTRRDRFPVRALPRMTEKRADVVGDLAREHVFPKARGIRSAFRAYFENLIEENLGEAIPTDKLFGALSPDFGELDIITVPAKKIGSLQVGNHAAHLRPSFADCLDLRVPLFVCRPHDTEGFLAVMIELTM